MSDENVLEPQDDAGEQTQGSPDVEKQARDMGWKPEGEWKGDPPRNGFLSAEDYVKRGEEVLPIVRTQLKRSEAERAELKDTVAQMKREHGETIKRLERMSGVALQQQRTQLESQYAARKEAAVEVGDKDAYRQVVKEEKEAIATMDERLAEPEEDKKAKAGADMPASVKQTLDEWTADNRWFDANDEMKSWAVGYHGKLLKDKPGMTLRENLEMVSQRARKLFPDAFGESTDDGAGDDDPPRRRVSAVEGGSRSPSGNGRSMTSKLPADAKAQATKFIREDGLFLEKGETSEKDFNKAMERYAAQYFEGEAR